MKTTRPTNETFGGPYGLGIQKVALPCGGDYWGHGGDIPGFQTMSGATTDGRSAVVMTNQRRAGQHAVAPSHRTGPRKMAG